VCTGLNKNVWPFPSLNVFSELPKDKTGQWIIRVTSGSETYDLDPGNALPVEFFVARSIVGEVAFSQDKEKLNSLLDYINAHLADSRSRFDERWEKIKINPAMNTKIQIVLKVSKIDRYKNYKSNTVDEYLVGEKSYAR
jgi:hypothetical protein